MSADHQRETRLKRSFGERISGVSLRVQVLIAAVLLAVVPMAAVAYLLNANTTQSLENEAEAAVANEAQALQTTLDELIDSYASDVLLVAQTESLYFTSADLAQREEFIVDHLDVWNYATDITIVDPNGRVLVGVEPPSSYSSQFESQYFQRTAALEAGQVFVGDVGPDPVTGEPVVSIAAPSYAEGGVFLGVTRIAWPVANLNDFLSGLTAAAERDVNVYDSNGSVIGSSDPAPSVLMGAVQSEALQRAVQGESGVVREAFAQPGRDPEQSFVAYGSVAPSERVAILDWAVTVSTPEAVVLESVDENTNQALLLVVAGIIAALIVAFILARFFLRPIQRLSDVATEVAAGNFGARAQVGGPAEISATGVAFNRMLDEVTSLIQTREERDAIQIEVSRLLGEVSGVARGDLTVETNPDEIRDETLGSIASSFNYMVRQLREIVSNVNETTNEVTSASTGIAQRSSSLAQVSSGNSQRITETVSSLDEMILSIEQVNSNARLSSTVALEARGNAEAGAQAMRETIEALHEMRDQIQEAGRTVTRLGESSQEIGQTVQLISQIARQTNTLALNASIQAARAGEHGRGFSVVAEEVRKLAERAGAATRQVESMVTTIQADTDEAVTAMTIGSRQVAEGVDLAARTGSRLEEIDAVINRLGELIDDMAFAAEEQAATAVGLAQSMRLVSVSTAESTESTQDAAESATMLARLAERLRESVAVFRLGEDENQQPVPQAGTPSPTPADGD